MSWGERRKKKDRFYNTGQDLKFKMDLICQPVDYDITFLSYAMSSKHLSCTVHIRVIDWK